MRIQLSSRAALGARRARRGFTIIELLIALIIIGILVTIITPRLSDRAEQARDARARQDMEEIQLSQEKVFIDIGYIVRLHVLDDIGGTGDGFPPQDPQNANDFLDALGDEAIGGGLFDPRQDLVFIDPDALTANGENPQPALPNLLNQLVNQTESGFLPRQWRGPYLTYHIDRNSRNNPGEPTYVGDDPWGNDYLLFTREGLMLEPDGQFVANVTFNQLTGTTAVGTADCRVFDRPTVVTMGPNGLPGNGSGAVGDNFGTGDDIIRQF